MGGKVNSGGPPSGNVKKVKSKSTGKTKFKISKLTTKKNFVPDF